MKYDFDRINERRNTECVKWDGVKDVFGRDDVLPFWVADMDFKAPNEVIEVITKKAEHGIYGYPYRTESCLQSIIKWVNKRHGWAVDKDWLTFTPGVVPALSIAVLTFTKPGDKVIIQTPIYPPFYNVIKDNGREVVKNPLKFENNRYTMDFEDLQRKIDSGAKMIILCSPHNPVGRVWDEEELNKLSEMCIKNDVLLISDEIHADIVYGDNKHLPIAGRFAEMKKRTITCMAPSKTFNIAGLSSSFIIIPDEKLRAAFNSKVNSLFIGGANVFGLAAMEATYTYGQEWLDELLVYLEKNAEFAVKYIEENIPQIKTTKPEGTYLMWLDFSSLNITHEELKSLLINKAKVGLNSGLDFGEEGNGHMRLNIACPREILKKGLDGIAQAINSIK